MGRGRHCTNEKRQLIKKLRNEGKTYKEIKLLLGCSDQMIANAMKYKEKSETRGRKRKTTVTEDRRIARFSRKDPFASSQMIRDDLGLSVSSLTIRRRLLENKLTARSPRKVPMLTKKHVAARLQFAKTHANWPLEKWRNILWTDETKIVLFGGTGSRQYVRRPENSAYKPQYTVKTVKHGGAKVMAWGSFSYSGIGPIHQIIGTMDQRAYVDILSNVMLPHAEWNMPLKWVFQQDNDPKQRVSLLRSGFASMGLRLCSGQLSRLTLIP